MEPVWYLLSGDTGLLWDTDVYRVLFMYSLRSRRSRNISPMRLLSMTGVTRLLLIMGLYVRSKMESFISMMLLSWGGKM